MLCTTRYFQLEAACTFMLTDLFLHLHPTTVCDSPKHPRWSFKLTSVSTSLSLLSTLLILSSLLAGWVLPLWLCWADKWQDSPQCSKLCTEARYSSACVCLSYCLMIYLSLSSHTPVSLGCTPSCTPRRTQSHCSWWKTKGSIFTDIV